MRVKEIYKNPKYYLNSKDLDESYNYMNNKNNVNKKKN
jgi:hypothetical protein